MQLHATRFLISECAFETQISFLIGKRIVRDLVAKNEERSTVEWNGVGAENAVF